MAKAKGLAEDHLDQAFAQLISVVDALRVNPFLLDEAEAIEVELERLQYAINQARAQQSMEAA